MIRSLIFCLALIVLCIAPGLSNAQEFVVVNPNLVRAVVVSTTARLPDKATWVRSQKGTELGLLPGVYTASSETEFGRFYLGAVPSLFMKTVRGQYLLAYGGVWLPQSQDHRPRFFFVQDDTVRRGATLEEAISAVPAEPYQGSGWLLNMILLSATRGNLVQLAEIDDQALVDRLRTEFATK
jgi:hypothetical protein